MASWEPKDLARILAQDGYAVAKGSGSPTIRSMTEMICEATGKSVWASEWAFQKAVFDHAEALAHDHPEIELMYAVPNGQYRKGQRLEAGVKAGVPDIALPVARHGYHSLYIELKILGNTRTPNQVQWAQMLTRENNFVTCITESLDDVLELLKWYLKGATDA